MMLDPRVWRTWLAAGEQMVFLYWIFLFLLLTIVMLPLPILIGHLIAGAAAAIRSHP